MNLNYLVSLAILVSTSAPLLAQNYSPVSAIDGPPLATVNLATQSGVDLVQGTWRYHDVELVEVPFRAAGPDGQPGAEPNRAIDYRPHAGPRDFPDASWGIIRPAGLATRRSNGLMSFAWYRIRITIPQHIEGFDPTGTTVVFETVLDDYAEIWVDGELPRRFGQRGGSVVAGWNAPNRLVIGRNVKPGQEIQLAIFGINGPISAAPTNYIYLRSARLTFHSGGWEPIAVAPHEVNVVVERYAPAIDDIIPLNPKLFKLADGFTFTEGPVWQGDGDGRLLFSDPNENRIYQYSADGRLSVFRERSGYAGSDVERYRQPGSNGLTFDGAGRLTIAEHGNRRVVRLETDGSVTVLADRYQGRRLNSPNDIVYKSDGSLYFTDPPFGLPGFGDDPDKELDFSGVYRLEGTTLVLLTDELKGPNGIAFSPREDYLYVGDWDPEHKVVMRYPVHSDGTLGTGEPFLDLTDAPYEDAIDGVKVDINGNVYVSGPGGITIVASDGRLLGTVRSPKHAHNFAWGGPEGRDLYITARQTLYRMPLLVAGIRP